MPRLSRIIAALAVAAVTLVAFWPVLDNGFVDIDDLDYVVRNPAVQRGLTLDALRWAATTLHASNWHPLTWVSHIVDWSLYGAEARGHHLTSLLLHVVNAVLLFLVLARMTGAVGASALVAMLFGVHPLHVESVAWVAERKDVLSALFFMLALAAHARRARTERVGSLALVAVLFLLGLTAKPMLVSLPLVLLLLDWWPLGRWRDGDRRRLVLEKLPLALLAAGSALVTIVAQRRGGSVAPFAHYALGTRVENAVVSYVAYLGDMVWPGGLTLLYPHPGASLAAWQVGAAAALLAAVTAVVILLRARAPYLLMGWLWYLVALLPVIGVVQVGRQARADRYTYLPSIGIFIAIVWGLGHLGGLVARRAGIRADAGSRWALLPVVLALPVLVAVTWTQIGYWRDSRALFTRAIAVTGGDATAHWGLGFALANGGELDAAIEHYRIALRLEPTTAEIHHNLAKALEASGRIEEAVAEYRTALALLPNLVKARRDYGRLLVNEGVPAEALEQYEAWARLAPESADAHHAVGQALLLLGQPREALPALERAVALRPDYGAAHSNLAAALVQLERPREASAHITLAREHGFEPPAALVRQLADQLR